MRPANTETQLRRAVAQRVRDHSTWAVVTERGHVDLHAVLGQLAHERRERLARASW
jgi:hypothetical protein